MRELIRDMVYYEQIIYEKIGTICGVCEKILYVINQSVETKFVGR